MINQRISKLRQLMKERGIDLYIVPTSDFHQSEYVGNYFFDNFVIFSFLLRVL